MPKKTKKGKGGRKMKEGASEAQSKEEMAAKNVHSRTLSLQAKLEAEKTNSAAKMLEVNEGWRLILRKTQDPELRQHIMMLKQQFEQETDGMDNTIKNLERGLLQKERQSARVRRAHLQNVKSLCALQDKRLNLVQEPWENCMEHISSKLKSQREQLLADSQQQEDNLEAAMSLMEDKHKAVMKDMHDLYLQSTKLYEDAYEERKEADTENKEESKQKLKGEPENDEWFRRMMERDTFDIQEVNKDMKKMMTDSLMREQNLAKVLTQEDVRAQQLQEKLHNQLALAQAKKLKTVIAKDSLMREQNLAKVLTQEDARAQQQQEKLRLYNQLAQAQKDGRKRLTNLTIQSNAAAKKLQTVIAKGQRVLDLGKACQTLERKLEKASAVSFSTMEHREEKTEAETEEPTKVSEFPELHQPTQRLNNAVLLRDALKKHRVELKQENKQLKLQLHKHLDDMTLSNNTFSAPDAPLTVHQALITRAPKTNTPNTNTPLTNTPNTSGPNTSAPKTNTPLTNTPLTNTPNTSGPNTRAPKTNTPNTDTPLTNTPLTNTPNTSGPNTSAPKTNTPNTSGPNTSALKTNTPLTNTPLTNTPNTSGPNTRAPKTNTPNTDTPLTNTPLTNTPNTSGPNTRASTANTPTTTKM
ncbi:Coiled-coil domain-containing protein 65 [Collichthys lucidus]|uniref:Dynein regulatory complex subunit 2 n=1 Tax=Collichthys lucidus TaxID=240159 RepID=A0A4U5UZ03_COLLU|nr:Coiled-coil domain-containing protein 65 [Collichthys lucidus]